MHEGPNGAGLSRKSIINEIDKSLRRLKTDYVDLYIIHRWDYNTPIEETMETLHDIVKLGKARYIGASSMYAWQFSKALHVAEKNGWTKFSTMQDLYNLLYREEEREMHPLCKDEKIGVTPWSPLAKGRLIRDWTESTNRSENDVLGNKFFPLTHESDREIISRVKKIAEDKGISRAQVALAWVHSKENITVPIIGVTTVSQIEDAVKSIDVRLTPNEVSYLESAYVTRTVTGFE